MNVSKADLINNPYLRRALSDHDATLLGLTEVPAPTHAGAPESTPPSTTVTGPKKRKPPPPSKPELQSHAEYLHWIKKLNRSLPTDQPLLALHADPTTKSGIIPGWPDFTLFYHASFRPLFIEFKRPRQGRLSPAQALIHRYLSTLGHHVYVVLYSYHAITITQNFFSLP